MGDLTANLSRHEFACECKCGFDAADKELVDVMQLACDDLSREFSKRFLIKVTGGNRCRKHNESIPGSAENSKHIFGIGADWCLIGLPAAALYSYLDRKYPDKYGMGLYSNRVHLDIRPQRARWSVN